MISQALVRASQKTSSYFSTPSTKDKIKPPSRGQMSLFYALVLLIMFLSLRNYTSFQLGTWSDDASYAVLAQSIASSDTYGLMNVPGQPLPTRYPFGFPLLLSPLAGAFPQAPDMMKLVSLAATLANAALLFWGWPLLSQSKSHWCGLVIAALYSVSPLVIGHTRMVMSEPAFTTFVLAALVLTEKHLAGDKDSLLATLLLGSMVTFALFVRTVGIALVLAVVGRILMLSLAPSSKGKRLLYLMAGSGGLIAIVLAATPVTVQSLLPIEYADQFGDPHGWARTDVEDALGPRCFGAFLAYARLHLREALIPLGGGTTEREFGKRFSIPDLPLLSGLAIGGMVLLGGVPVLGRHGLSPSVAVFAALYLGAILLWPWRGARFLYPIQPFLLYHLLLGIKLVAGQIRRVKLIPPDIGRFLVHLSTIGTIAVILLLSIYRGVTDNRDSLQYVRDLGVGATWIRDNSPNDALIMAEQPQSIYLYSQRTTINYINVSTTTELEQVIELQGLDYILVAPKLEWQEDGSMAYATYTGETLLPLLDALVAQRKLELTYQSDEDMVQVYQVIDP